MEAMFRRRKCTVFIIIIFVAFIWGVFLRNILIHKPRISSNISLDELPPLVWRHAESSHPYFLSPFLEFKEDVYRRRRRFDLSGMDAVYKRAETEEKIIVIYNMPGWHTMESRYAHSLDNCRIQSCRLTNDKKLLPRAHGVVFYVLDLAIDLKPPPKPDNQMWIFFAHEAPWNFTLWNNMFNWTMTFRFDSDIVCPYFVIMLKSRPDVRDFESITRHKSAPVMWLVSHCGARSKRDEYVRELQKYIQVDVYGGCGPLKCAKSGYNSCDQIQNRKYKFYLAFENSMCRGYITEKLFRCYTLDIIPVVRGGARYSQLLPPGTYINTADFPSPRLLAARLRYLDGNETAYVEMLEKKSQFTVSDPKSTLDSSLCDICVKLHDLKRFANSYSNLNKWWTHGTCSKPTDV